VNVTFSLSTPFGFFTNWLERGLAGETFACDGVLLEWMSPEPLSRWEPTGGVVWLHVRSAEERSQYGPAVRLSLVATSPQSTEVTVYEAEKPLRACFLQRLAVTYPEAAAIQVLPSGTEPTPTVNTQSTTPLGTHGGTLARLKEARALIEHGMGMTKACRRAHLDTRTYHRYAVEVVDWEADDLNDE